MPLLTAAKSNNFTNFTSLYNGNIGAMITDLKHFGASGKLEMKYSYDQLNRIMSAQQSSGNAYATAYTYDRNGNLLTLHRKDSLGNTLHDFDYIYYHQSNKLKNVDGSATENYRYDAIGNLISDASENIDTIQWTVYGKVARVVKANGSEVSYVYDASGNRVTKTFENDTATIITRYIRDASGNIMAIYDDTTVTERPIYGFSRLGMLRGLAQKGQVLLGIKSYELSNHLGNVLTTISDRKIGVDAGADGTVDHFEAEVLSVSDYYPFGLAMVGRSYSANEYRFGFNGMEKSDEVADGNYTAMFWEYSPKTARRWNVDPVVKEWESSYAAFAGNPLYYVDPAGNNPWHPETDSDNPSDQKLVADPGDFDDRGNLDEDLFREYLDEVVGAGNYTQEQFDEWTYWAQAEYDFEMASSDMGEGDISKAAAYSNDGTFNNLVGKFLVRMFTQNPDWGWFDNNGAVSCSPTLAKRCRLAVEVVYGEGSPQHSRIDWDPQKKGRKGTTEGRIGYQQFQNNYALWGSGPNNYKQENAASFGLTRQMRLNTVGGALEYAGLGSTTTKISNLRPGSVLDLGSHTAILIRVNYVNNKVHSFTIWDDNNYERKWKAVYYDPNNPNYRFRLGGNWR